MTEIGFDGQVELRSSSHFVKLFGIFHDFSEFCSSFLAHITLKNHQLCQMKMGKNEENEEKPFTVVPYIELTPFLKP